MRWPGHIASGSESDQPFAFYDLMPTFCDMAGIRNYEQRYRRPQPLQELQGTFPVSVRRTDYFDGISILPTLLGLPARQRQHDHLYWEFHETDMIGVRKGDWKLVVRRGQPALYNLATDPHEDHDLAAQHPDILRRLIRLIYEDHTDSSLFPITLPSLP